MLYAVAGWTMFTAGWVGVFVPGMPTTIFWILAALAFLRSNRKMYERIISHRRFGPGIKLFIEEGKISRRGKMISITAMLGFATISALIIPPLWVKLVVIAAATAGSVWVGVLKTPEAAEKASPEVSPSAPPSSTASH